jgi:hypothetical protein
MFKISKRIIMVNGRFLLAGLLLITLAHSCTKLETRTREKSLAHVFEKHLYPSDIRDIFPNNVSPEDSIMIQQNYVDKWVKKQLILQKAELNLTEEQKDVRLQIEEYRSSLLIYKYEQNLILQKLDTLISDEEIETYYLENPSNFNLDRHIVKALFLKLPIDAPEIWRVRQMSRSENEEDFRELESYCYQHGVKYDYFDDNWTPFSTITRALPNEIRTPESFLRWNRYIEQQDSAFRYMVNLKEYSLAGTVAPLPYVEQKIRSIILNKRKVQFVRDLENNIYKDALNKGSFTIY